MSSGIIRRRAIAAMVAASLATCGCAATREWAAANEVGGPCLQPQHNTDAIVNCPAQIVDMVVLFPVLAIDIANQLRREHRCRTLLADLDQRQTVPAWRERLDELSCRRIIDAAEQRNLLARTQGGC